MGARWTEQEEVDLCDYVNENYLSFEKTVEWSLVSSNMTTLGYNRTSESCRKRYRQLEKESVKESEEIEKTVYNLLSGHINFVQSMRKEDWQINASPINESSPIKDNPYLIKELPKVEKSDIKSGKCKCGRFDSCQCQASNEEGSGGCEGCGADDTSYVEENSMAIRLVVMSLVLIIIIGCAKYFLGG